MEEMLQEASESRNVRCGARLLETSRNVAEMFVDISLQFHKGSLESFPQHAALFYNNSMFLARQLALLGPQYGERGDMRRLTSAMGSHLTFVDLVPRLKRIGKEAMTQQLRVQKMQISEALSPATDFSLIGQDGCKREVCLKAVKQCQLQLSRLSRLWLEVLEMETAYAAMAALVSYLLNFIVDKLIAIEDIRADDGSVFVDMMTDLANNLKRLFVNEELQQTDSNIHVYCHPSYARFLEFLKVLSGSLEDILDGWADGHGPLAHYFESTQIQHLIRALFQNTQVRAVALSKIKKVD